MISIRAKSLTTALRNHARFSTATTTKRIVPIAAQSCDTNTTTASPPPSPLSNHHHHSLPPNSTSSSRRKYSSTASTSFSAPAASSEIQQPETASASTSTSSTPRKNVYMWGTSKKGTIPLSILSDTSTGGGGIFSGDEKVIDHPMRLNLEGGVIRSFLEGGGEDGKESTSGDTTDDDVVLDKIFCGASGTAMVLGDGRCFVVGSNKNGELGIGSSTKETTKPIQLSLPDPIAKASLGPNFSALLTTTGDLYTCGFGGSRVNGIGCLGQGSMDSYPTPTIVNSLIEDGCYAADVHCGEYSMTVLTTEGEVLTCGSGSYGRLGNVETVDQLYLEPVELMGAEDVVQIAGGFAFSLALNKGGLIHAWGRNNEGQLGCGMGLAVDMYAMESIPRPIEGDLEGRQVTRIAAGHTHAAAVTSNGELFTWGMNMTHEPKLETTLLHTKVVDVACGQNYTMALDAEGRLYSLGKGKTGVLGLASTKASAYPILVEGIPDSERVVSLSCGYAHVACVTEPKERL